LMLFSLRLTNTIQTPYVITFIPLWIVFGTFICIPCLPDLRQTGTFLQMLLVSLAMWALFLAPMLWFFIQLARKLDVGFGPSASVSGFDVMLPILLLDVIWSLSMLVGACIGRAEMGGAIGAFAMWFAGQIGMGLYV